MNCNRCGSRDNHIEVRGVHTGLFCDNCGRWIKWLNGSEIKSLENGSHVKVESVPKHKDNHNITQEGIKVINNVTVCCGYDLGYMGSESRFCPVCGRGIVVRL